MGFFKFGAGNFDCLKQILTFFSPPFTPHNPADPSSDGGKGGFRIPQDQIPPGLPSQKGGDPPLGGITTGLSLREIPHDSLCS